VGLILTKYIHDNLPTEFTACTLYQCSSGLHPRLESDQHLPRKCSLLCKNADRMLMVASRRKGTFFAINCVVNDASVAHAVAPHGHLISAPTGTIKIQAML